MKHSGGVRKEPSWADIAKASEVRGWFPQKMEKGRVVLERGRQKIVATRLAGSTKWKVEYFSGRIMDDTTGSETEFFAKRLAIEMAVFK